MILGCMQYFWLDRITVDNAQLSIMIDDKEIWSGDYWSIFKENDNMTSNIYTSEHGVLAKGDNEALIHMF